MKRKRIIFSDVFTKFEAKPEPSQDGFNKVLILAEGPAKGHMCVEQHGRLKPFNPDDPEHAKLEKIPIFITAETLQQVADSGNARSEVKAKLDQRGDHAGGVSDTFGGYSNFRVEGNSVYVAQSFKDSVFKLEACLKARGIDDVQVLTGDCRPDHRVEAVDAFQMDRARVLVATLGAGGLSISLHRTKPEQRPRTSILRVGYSAAEFVQALGRIHRAGGLGGVLQRIPLLAGTIEERVFRRLNAKLKNIETLVDSDLL